MFVNNDFFLSWVLSKVSGWVWVVSGGVWCRFLAGAGVYSMIGISSGGLLAEVEKVR